MGGPQQGQVGLRTRTEGSQERRGRSPVRPRAQVRCWLTTSGDRGVRSPRRGSMCRQAPWFPECVPAAHSHLARPFSSRCSLLSNQPQPVCRQKPAQVRSLRAGPCSLHGVLKPPISSLSVGMPSPLQQPQESHMGRVYRARPCP